MRILVSGAAGFLGWNLTRHLRALHPEAVIVGVDNLWTGVRRPGREAVSVMHECDIESPVGIPIGGFDYVYHLASPASPKHYQSDPLRTVRANVLGLMRCMDLVAQTGTLFMCSTSEVYGDPRVSPQHERYNGSVCTTGVRSCYDESKRLCETMTMDYFRRHGGLRPAKIARLFNVYGPGTLENDGRAMSNFVCQMLRGQPITVYGSGKQTRCFTYVADVIDAIVKLVEDTNGAFVGPINIGSNTETSVHEIAQAVLNVGELLGCQVNRSIEYMDAAEDDPKQRRPDLRLARNKLGWGNRPLIQYGGQDGGIARTIRHFQAEMQTQTEREHWRA